MVMPVNMRLYGPNGRVFTIESVGLVATSVSDSHCPSYKQLQFHFDQDKAERYAYSAAEWIVQHWSEFVECMDYVDRQVDTDNPCTMRDNVMVWERDKRISMSNVPGIMRNHNLWAGVARYMTMLRPRLARTLKFRKSGMDELDLVSIWHEVVHSDTEFLARDILEAKRLVEMDDAAAQ